LRGWAFLRGEFSWYTSAVRAAVSGKFNLLEKTTFYDLRVSQFTSSPSSGEGKLAINTPHRILAAILQCVSAPYAAVVCFIAEALSTVMDGFGPAVLRLRTRMRSFRYRIYDRRLLPMHRIGISLVETQNSWFRVAVRERYKLSLFLPLLRCSLQGVAERPLPCNYYAIQ
jgi:hypothetical protein